MGENLSSHKTDRVQEFPSEHRRVHLHDTPTYSPWLNPVDNGFARTRHDVISRGAFASIKDLDTQHAPYS
ncbi:hypothetical protein FPJ27_15300 [Burkholderia sp. MS455]|nr:hypothetical protein FPJ27_15300 [Burkholderia sp. MS455]